MNKEISVKNSKDLLCKLAKFLAKNELSIINIEVAPGSHVSEMLYINVLGGQKIIVKVKRNIKKDASDLFSKCKRDLKSTEYVRDWNFDFRKFIQDKNKTKSEARKFWIPWFFTTLIVILATTKDSILIRLIDVVLKFFV